MAKRTVSIELTDEFNQTCSDRNVPPKLIDTAVGYLVGWAIHSGGYPTVSIWGDGDGNLHAIYSGPVPPPAAVGPAAVHRQYAIMGLLSGEGPTAGYSFHS